MRRIQGKQVAGGGIRLIWRPGGPSQSGVFFTDWNALAACAVGAAPAGATGYATVVVDDTFQIPAPPPGNYPWLGDVLGSPQNIGRGNNGLTLFELGSGVLTPKLRYVYENIEVRCTSTTTSPITIGDSELFTIRGQSLVDSDPGAQPVIVATPGSGPIGPFVNVDDFSVLGLGNNDVHIAPLPAATNRLFIVCENGGSTDPNSVFGGVFGSGLTMFVTSPAAYWIQGQPMTQPGVVDFILDDYTQTAPFFTTSAEASGAGPTSRLLVPGYATILPLSTGAIGVAIGITTKVARPFSTQNIRFTGDPANVGITVTFRILVNGAPVAGVPDLGPFPADAAVGGGGMTVFPLFWPAANSFVQWEMIPSGVLAAPITLIQGILQ
jgi:hypothetical protein